MHKITEQLLALAVPINSIKPDPANPRENHDVDGIAKSFNDYGQCEAIVVNKTTKMIEAGHGRLYAAQKLGWSEVAVNFVDHTPDEAIKYNIAANRLSDLSRFNDELLLTLLQSLDEPLEVPGIDDAFMAELLENVGGDLLGGDSEGGGEGEGDTKELGKLARYFGAPPFSILDSRQGRWQDRKREWTGIGIDSGDGRDDALIDLSALGDIMGRRIGADSSIFDPVLAELMYSWFSPVDGVVLDPFAGGSVRGIVAGVLGRNYTGVDLRPEQVEANDKQAATCKEIKNSPKWITGDSRNIDELCNGVKADFVFSCPPYYDLEQYSDDPNDLSKAKTYQDFLADYRVIISKAVKLLNDNRFACFVVGDIRDKKGFYCNFVSDTIAAFQDAGAKLYNEAILVNITGSLAVRAGKVFKSGRKLGKSHQNVLIFCKGDFKIATQNLGDVVVYDMDGNEVNDDESADGVSGGKLPNGVEEL